EIDVEVFGFGRPVRREGEFEACAKRPSGIRCARGQSGGGGIDVAECGAASHEGQETIGCIADTPAHRRQPGIHSLATRGTSRGRRCAGDARPVDVGFGAEHKMADLVDVADCTTDEPTGRVDASGRVPGRASERSTAVYTEIEAGPGEEW